MTQPLLVAIRGLAFALCVAMLPTACQRGDTSPPTAIKVTAPARSQPALKPVDAVNVLRERLLARDGAGFARLAVPPNLHARLAEGWQAGSTRWPLDELPLDTKLSKMLAALQEKNAESKLMATFRRQFAGADRDIDQAIRTLVLFGGEYVQKDADYTPDEREHAAQALAALGSWALAAPFSEPRHAQPFFGALAAAAQRSGIDGKAGNAAFATLGMDPGLNRLSPFIATLLAQLRTQYGLDVDAALRGAEVRLLEQTGDSARLRLRYTLAGTEIDAIVPVRRIDGHWYLADYLRRAEASLAGKAGAAGGKNASSP
ncbi:MAG: hypothetical protein EOP93_05555 [Lysobacteraceae bacterium]|nr:MAG: hypothetical protein EOP93_05555 [Xanthomonadaceae bacterium]